MLPPIKLSPQQDDLCKRLDELDQKNIQGQNLSDMFRGAIYATREENQSNPDWMAQSAHSFREILYPFYKKHSKVKIGDALNSYGSATATEITFKRSLGTVYGKITDVAHHQSDLSNKEYRELINEFEEVLLWALTRQIDIHNQIDELLSGSRPGKKGEM